MINKEFYYWLKDLSIHPSFLETLALADRLIDEQYHMELALRFFIYKNISLNDIKGVYDLADFVTQKMIEYANSMSFDLQFERNIFIKTFDYINDTIGDDAFKRYNLTKNIFQGRFLLSMYETIAVGVGKNIAKGDLSFTNSEVKEKVSSVWRNQDFQNRTGSGVSVSSRLPVLIPLGESLFEQ